MADTSSEGGGPLRFFRAINPITIGGVGFVYISGFIFLFVSQRLVRADAGPGTLQAFYPELILCSIAIFTALLGVSLLRATGVASLTPGPVINPDEWKTLSDEIKQGHEESITQYVRLRSLSGLTGFFTKLGLQGLPLATIGLTILFSLLFLKDEKYLDLAKLTLGAFIGSFVQKQVNERQGSAGTVQLPTGETLKVQSPPPAGLA
jgi:hypothetical protein